jgi:hypothetical protein
MGVNVTPLENDNKLQDLVLSIHHATMHTFSGTPASKIIENHLGRAWVRRIGQFSVAMPGKKPVSPPNKFPTNTPANPSQPIPTNRAERRRLEREKR